MSQLLKSCGTPLVWRRLNLLSSHPAHSGMARMAPAKSRASCPYCISHHSGHMQALDDSVTELMYRSPADDGITPHALSCGKAGGSGK